MNNNTNNFGTNLITEATIINGIPKLVINAVDGIDCYLTVGGLGAVVNKTIDGVGRLAASPKIDMSSIVKAFDHNTVHTIIAGQVMLALNDFAATRGYAVELKEIYCNITLSNGSAVWCDSVLDKFVEEVILYLESR